MITNREQQIVDMRDEGLTIDEIAAKLDLAPSYVRGRIGYLCSNLGLDRNHEKMMARGSQALLAAIECARAA